MFSIIAVQNCNYSSNQLEEIMDYSFSSRRLYNELFNESILTTRYRDNILETLDDICKDPVFKERIKDHKKKCKVLEKVIDERNKEELKKVKRQEIINLWTNLSERDQYLDESRKLEIANLICDCYNIENIHRDWLLKRINEK